MVLWLRVWTAVSYVMCLNPGLTWRMFMLGWYFIDFVCNSGSLVLCMSVTGWFRFTIGFGRWRYCGSCRTKYVHYLNVFLNDYWLINQIYNKDYWGFKTHMCLCMCTSDRWRWWSGSCRYIVVLHIYSLTSIDGVKPKWVFFLCYSPYDIWVFDHLKFWVI